MVRRPRGMEIKRKLHMEKDARNVAQGTGPAAQGEGQQSYAAVHGFNKGNALTCSVVLKRGGGIAWEAVNRSADADADAAGL